MLIPLFQKAEASETVSPVGRNLAASAFIKEVGLSSTLLTGTPNSCWASQSKPSRDL